MPAAKPSSPSLLKAGISGVVIFGLLLFAVIAMNTTDILWFWPVFNEVPVEIDVNCYGKAYKVTAGQPSFQVVNEAVNSSMTGNKRWDETSMSDVTFEEYKTGSTALVVMLHYDPPVTVHSQYAFFKDVNWLIIPLDGRLAGTFPIFGREGDFTDPGSFHIKSTAPIVAALQESGICAKR